MQELVRGFCRLPIASQRLLICWGMAVEGAAVGCTLKVLVVPLLSGAWVWFEFVPLYSSGGVLCDRVAEKLLTGGSGRQRIHASFRDAGMKSLLFLRRWLASVMSRTLASLFSHSHAYYRI
jgi:hypothetical protein